jgi:hypothetical protein
MDAIDPKSLDLSAVVWKQPDGRPVACREKLKVLSENLDEIRQCCQDALEDAVLMGCDEGQVREVFEAIVRSIRNPYASDD